MANGLPDDVTFTPPTQQPQATPQAAQTGPHDMSDVTFTPPQQTQSETPHTGSVLGDLAIGALKGTTEATIGPPPPTTATEVLHKVARIPINPIKSVADALDAVTGEIENYTQAGRAEHPILAHIGDATRAAKELLVGGTTPMGPKEGVLNSPVTNAVSAVPAAGELVPAGISKLTEAVRGIRAAREAKVAAELASNAAKVSKVNPEQFVYREPTPAPQHGAPVKVASPLDNATINRLPGGKDLSPEAVTTLKTHIGGAPGQEIEVGSTPKNTLLKAVGPVRKTLAETGVKMSQAIADAPEFSTNTISDPNSTILKDLNDVRDNLPLREDDPLNSVVDKQLQAAYPALESTNPQEILEMRRKLSNQIDWNNITQNPETAGETKNLVQIKIYRALSNKLHTEIPKMAELDKVFQPNLELQSHLDAKLGTTLSRDPAEADAQRVSELSKGRQRLDDEAYNEVILKNRQLAGMPESDAEASIQPAGVRTPIDESVDQALDKFGIPDTERPALKTLIQPSVKSGKVFGTNTDWPTALRSFDKLTPEERAARFSDPVGIRDVLKKQARTQLGKAVVKYGSIAAVAHLLGIDRAILRYMLSE